MSVKKTLINFFKNHKLRLLLIVLSIALVTVLALIPAQILRIIVDEIIPTKDNERLMLFAIFYSITYLGVGISAFLKNYIMMNTASYLTNDIRLAMMKKIECLSYQELVNFDAGALEAHFNNDVNSINELFTSGVADMITDSFKMIGIIISIFIYSLTFGYIVLGIIPLLVLFTSFVRRQMLKAQLKTKSLEGNVNEALLENVECIEQIKVNKADSYVSEKYAKILNNHYIVKQKATFFDAFFSPFMQILKNVVVCSVLLISGFNASFFGMTIGMIISAITLITDLFQPIENIGMEIQTIQKSVAAVKIINKFFRLPSKKEVSFNDLKNLKLVFDKVSFSYTDKEVIKDFSLIINEGDHIALHGNSGAGKSTLMKLAMGIIVPNKGEVQIGGVSPASFNEVMRKNLFSVVYQDPFFSGGSIYEEISLLDKNISHEEVKKALELVGLNYICNIDLILNEKEYSSGELALFNIARVVVRNPKIIFLDEMNAKIDPLTGKRIIELINIIAKDKIVISINHYGSSLSNAKIIKI